MDDENIMSQQNVSHGDTNSTVETDLSDNLLQLIDMFDDYSDDDDLSEQISLADEIITLSSQILQDHLNKTDILQKERRFSRNERKSGRYTERLINRKHQAGLHQDPLKALTPSISVLEEQRF
ncbi:hypothetical protein BLNAU_12916 [Blattamonas nauphoetae]|uniref:Uncharacterized protein n=1 Tax=Blattamonas nauphoetae TaxID=2049346 RepID=A0ABQ9XLJ2_9EUKA|nr:hypothetical protein BLNAU_12916 [Blattamonas nauphoetae]